ncbi:helicase HerA-like domain-containing protein [Membranihabitans maritimus]|uniref:helicase HerA-like domain-containing protein n=1 Tax=Membranihabitans maritimus TaxID=2904244 RepID=UPI001F2B0B34|nr:helicase HerA-like domain-containing protein [Membranihabitans maritimus]
MAINNKFAEEIGNGYTFEGSSLILGGAMLRDECITNLLVKAPLSTFNRHGMISGATGTGKTKSLQVLSEHLSNNGVPSLVMDIKGDLSGLAKANAGHKKIDERQNAIGLSYDPHGFPVELLTLSGTTGIKLRATLSEFGPILFSRILELNDTQSSIVTVVFKFCDDNNLPLIDLEDFRKTLLWMSGEGKHELQIQYGRIHGASVGAIIRKLITLEQQGANIFFGEPSFEVDDLCRLDSNGNGYISILRLMDLMDRPQLFSTFMLQMLAEIYSSFPEEGDLDKPKLVLFIDEAHLIFQDASKELLRQIETTVKLIRSKGIGVFFVTQNPNDIPESVLSQLGMKVQHALRAFTASDREDIQKASKNFPISAYYDISEVLTRLGIGEALVTVLNEDGRPTPLVRTMMRAPESRMDILSNDELMDVERSSDLFAKYDQIIDRESAYEILSEKMAEAKEERLEQVPRKTSKRYKKPTQTYFEKTLEDAGKQITREVSRGIVRGILGVLGLGNKRSSKSKGWFF